MPIVDFTRISWLTPRLVISLMLYSLASLGAVSLVHLAFTGNLSPSEPEGIYRITHEPLAHGAFVILKMPIKRIAGLPGDVIEVTPAGIYINDRLWPDSKPMDDQRLAHYPFGTYALGPGQLWVMGNHPLSWDSRYFGPIDQKLVIATAEPVFTKESR